MAVEIRVPPLGESLVEATVGQWLKREGEPVAAGESVVELETEKVNLQVGAETSGVLEHIGKGAGETVRVGETLGTIAAAPLPAANDGTPPTAPPSTANPAADALPTPHPASPVARQMAAEHGK